MNYLYDELVEGGIATIIHTENESVIVFGDIEFSNNLAIFKYSVDVNELTYMFEANEDASIEKIFEIILKMELPVKAIPMQNISTIVTLTTKEQLDELDSHVRNS